jgi:hypothetical protein
VRRFSLDRLGTDRLIRAAVLVILLGLLLVVGVVLRISALTVGLYMLGSLLITVGIVLYLVAVLGELRRQRAI